jgi:hypothetical protein
LLSVDKRDPEPGPAVRIGALKVRRSWHHCAASPVNIGVCVHSQQPRVDVWLTSSKLVPRAPDMFFGIAQERYNQLAPEVRVFLSLAHGYHNAVPIVRAAAQDKEFHFQNWVRSRIAQSGLAFETQGRHGYPDFVLNDHAAGFEVKGLSVHPVTGAGRVNDFDCNSQLPLAAHDGRKVFYIFGRYPW